MIPAPVTRSATTVPGSGIAVGVTEVGEGYMFPKSPGGAITAGSVAGSCTGSSIGVGDSTTGTSCTGSAIGAGDSTTGTSCTGSAIGAGDSTTGTSCTGSAMTGDGWGAGDCGLLRQRSEKFPGPHTNCAEAGGAAAR